MFPHLNRSLFRILPVRREILLGVLYSDLLGFHTYDYARHFLSSCTRILSLPTMPNGVEFEGRLAHVGTFPIGIDPTSFTRVRVFCSVLHCVVNWDLRHL
jgi:trehalose 6-phosphate synthase